MMSEDHLRSLGADRPFSSIHDRIGEAEFIGRVVDLAENTDARFQEQVSGFCLVIVDRAETIAGTEFFDWPGDGIVQQGVVALEPDSKIGVAFESQARDNSRPIEAR